MEEKLCLEIVVLPHAVERDIVCKLCYLPGPISDDHNASWQKYLGISISIDRNSQMNLVLMRPVNSSHKWPVTRKVSPFDDVIMTGDTLHATSSVTLCRMKGCCDHFKKIMLSLNVWASDIFVIWPNSAWEKQHVCEMRRCIMYQYAVHKLKTIQCKSCASLH